MVCMSWCLSQRSGRRSTAGDGQTRGQLSFAGAKPTCASLRDVTACNNATASTGPVVAQTHYPGTWFLNQYASPGVSLSTKDRCSEEESHGRISTSVEQARQASRRVSGKSPGQLSSRAQLKTTLCSAADHSNGTAPRLSTLPHLPQHNPPACLHHLPTRGFLLCLNCGLCRPIPSWSPSRDTNPIDLAAASAPFHTR